MLSGQGNAQALALLLEVIEVSSYGIRFGLTAGRFGTACQLYLQPDFSVLSESRRGRGAALCLVGRGTGGRAVTASTGRTFRRFAAIAGKKPSRGCSKSDSGGA